MPPIGYSQPVTDELAKTTAGSDGPPSARNPSFFVVHRRSDGLSKFNQRTAEARSFFSVAHERGHRDLEAYAVASAAARVSEASMYGAAFA